MAEFLGQTLAMAAQSANPPVSQSATTNKSGAITTGGTSQTLAAANAARRYLLIQNKRSASESFWVRVDGTAAVTDSPSIEVAPGVTLTFEGSFVPTGQVNVIAATTGTKFTALEG